MVKKFLALTVAAMFMNFYSPPPVNAEQAAAETYRQLINSGKFFLAYSENLNAQKKQNLNADSEQYSGKKIAYENGMKISYSHSRLMDYYKSDYYKTGVYKKGAVFELPDTILPNVLYKDGKWYQFYDKDKAVVGNEENFSADYIDPDEHWELVYSAVALPEFLGAILPNNPNIPDFTGWLGNEKGKFSEYRIKVKTVSTLIESGTENLFGQNFNYDKYTLNFQYDKNRLEYSVNGQEITNPTQTYIFYYDSNGELKYVKETALDGKIKYICIDKFTGDIPTGFFNFPKGLKVYRMDTGTLADLLGIPELVEQY